MRAIFLFKRDLRLKDNRALEFAVRNFSQIVPVFIFDNDILNNLKVDSKRLSYIVEALEIISQKIKLYCLKDNTISALKRVFEIARPKAFIESKPLTWSGKERSYKISSLCKEYGIEYYAILDNVIAPIFDISPTQVFTPFYKKWINFVDISRSDIPDFSVPDLNLPLLEDIKPQLYTEKLNIFSPRDCKDRMLNFDYSSYQEKRNSPAIDGTSKLSPCIRFGILSPREIFSFVLNKSEQFIKELAWREFWYHISWHYPQSKDLELNPKRQGIRWQNDQHLIDAFLNAKTGYPIVDAGIRQLTQEKWLHNRVRMIVASFLTKVLLVDWRIGERFFMEHLIDYDEAVNTHSWQWSASVGADPRPFRLFNPMLQSSRHDPDCIYIKRYIPELSGEDCEALHDPLKFKLKYHKPVVNYYERIALAREVYRLR